MRFLIARTVSFVALVVLFHVLGSPPPEPIRMTHYRDRQSIRPGKG
jgi:hypothetical protein